MSVKPYARDGIDGVELCIVSGGFVHVHSLSWSDAMKLGGALQARAMERWEMENNFVQVGEAADKFVKGLGGGKNKDN